MTVEMQYKKQKTQRQHNLTEFIGRTAKLYRKKFKKKISVGQVGRIFDDYMDDVLRRVMLGEKVNIDSFATLEVIGRPLSEKPTATALLSKGKYVAGNRLKKADNISFKRKGFVYGYVYTNRAAKNRIYFRACPAVRKRLHETLINTNNYFVVMKNSNTNSVTNL